MSLGEYWDTLRIYKHFKFEIDFQNQSNIDYADKNKYFTVSYSSYPG